MDKITRITCDLDSIKIEDVIRCLKVFKRYGFKEQLTIRLSPSGAGFHVIAWNFKGVPFNKLMRIRQKAGDDKIRCRLDKMADRQIQVLFTKKTKKKIEVKE